MHTVIKLKNRKLSRLPREFDEDDDVRYSDSLVKYFVNNFTKEGDVVFDPFAGFGTSLIVAESMNRVPIGLEFLPDRFQYIQKHLKNSSAIILGDSRKLSEFDLPQFDLSITSPPFMTKNDHPENPFEGYLSLGYCYDSYFNDLLSVYTQIRKLMKNDSHIVIEAPSIKHKGTVTTLAWDIARSLSTILNFEGEIVIEWDVYGFGYNHSYCLVFSK